MFRTCPFCAHDKPIVVTIAGDPPAYVIACPECGTHGPKQLPGVPVEIAIKAWNAEQRRVQRRWNAISRLNKSQLNRAAEALLPVDWKDPRTLCILLLAQWGVVEAGLHPEIEGQVQLLQDGDPVAAQAFVGLGLGGSRVK